MSQEKQEVDFAELERMTNEEEGYIPEQTTEVEPDVNQPQTQTNEPEAKPESAPVAPEVPVTENKSVEVKVDDVISKVSKETPYKTVDDLINGYKSSQSEVTKFIEQVKPHKQLIDDLSTDANLRQFIDQAVQLYRNPSLAQQYAQPQQMQGDGVNPAQYDLYTPEGQYAYQQAVEARAQKLAFETVNQRMSGWEQQQAIEKAKLEFSRKYPEQNPDDVLKFVQEKKNTWTLEDAFKIANYDKLKEQVYEQARKEISGKINEATKNTPVSSQASDKPSITPNEMMSYVTKYGLESANKKWGGEKVKSAIKQFTEENDF